LILWTAILVSFVVGGAIFAYFRIVAPFNQLRAILRRLAQGDFRPVLFSARKGVLRETSADVRRISELLQQLDQQIAAEGFSLKAILSSMVEGVVITDRAQRIRLINESLQRMLDLPQSPVNRTVIEVFFNPELQKAVEKTLFDGIARTIELTVRVPARDGYATKYIEVYASGLNPGPKSRPLGAVIVFHDVTPVKSLEAIRREFVANISHEFRTPLAIINGYVETLLDGALEDRATTEAWLKVMAKNGRRLSLLIEDLLTLSHLEYRSPELDFQKINLPELLDRVVERITPAILERRGRVTVEWSSEAAWAEADPRRMEQVFENLLENAVRHATSDEVVVTVTAQRLGEEIEIVISDNGPGIPYRDQPHIFERFYRVHKDRSRIAGGGTGLGLAIVKHVVLAHNGSIVVESVPGQGAAFRIRIPAVRKAPAKTGSRKAIETLPPQMQP
jgi:two-component system, OmpR family, phosphate regulon sensor histidine kinase PhoR